MAVQTSQTPEYKILNFMDPKVEEAAPIGGRFFFKILLLAKYTTWLLFASACLLNSLASRAQHVWVDPLGGPSYKVLSGYIKPDAYPAQKVVSLTVLDAQRKQVSFTRSVAISGLTITPVRKPALFLVEFEDGMFWFVENKKWVDTSKDFKTPGGREIASRPHSLIYSKTLLNWAPWMAQPLGQRFELVPVGPARPAVGKPFKLRLLLDGKPITNHGLEHNLVETDSRTNGQGEVIVIPVRGANCSVGHYFIHQYDRKLQHTLTAVLKYVVE